MQNQNDDLQQKIARAKLAMGGDKRHISPDLLVNSLVDKRKSSLQLSPSDLATNNNSTLSPEDLEKRKIEARLAMESAEYKKRREGKEKAEKDRKLMIEKVLELKQARIELERKRGLDSKSKLIYDEEKRRREEELYQKRLQTSKELISNIANDSKTSVGNYHTLNSDLNQQISSGKLTMAKIAMEEEARRRLATLPTKKPINTRSILIVIAVISFVTLGSLAVFFSLNLTSPTSSTIKPLTIDSIIFANKHQELILDNKNSSDINSELQNIVGTPAQGIQIINIYPTKQMTIDGNTLKTLAVSKDLIASLGIDLPANFTHFLLDKFMIGVIGSPTGINSPFVILQTRSFENTLDALLRNETVLIPNILNPFLTNPLYINNVFEDKIISNIDTRISYDLSGEITAIYGFLDRNNVLITTNSQAFTDLLTAFQAPKKSI